MRLGVHVSIVGGLLEALARAKRLSCSTMQIFSRSPRGGPAPVFTDKELQAFHDQRQAADIDPLAVHCPYIINLASPDRGVFRRSVALYQHEYVRCHKLGARYFVTHVGSHKGYGDQAGIKRVADALNRTLSQGNSSVMILLENTAGAGQGLGYQFEQLRAIRHRVTRKDQIGICLDTAHLFAAGFPIHTKEGLEASLAQFGRVIGFDHLKMIHLNDSKAIFNSHADRHWHIGQGEIGLEAMRRIVNHPDLRELPFILETPKMTEEEDHQNLETVRRLVAPHANASKPVRSFSR